MRKNTLLAGFCGALLLSHTACQNNSSTEQATPGIEAVPITQAVYDPEADFAQAKEAFMNHQYEKSAEDMRKAIPYMRDLADVSDEQGRQTIDDAISTLEDLSHDVAFDRVNREQELTDYFGRAYTALAHSEIVAAHDLALAGKQAAARQMLDHVLRHMDAAAQRLQSLSDRQDEQIARDMEKLDRAIEQGDVASQTALNKKFAKLKTDLQALRTQLAKDSTAQAM